MSAIGQPQPSPLRAPFSIPRAFASTDPERLREVVALGRRADADGESATVTQRFSRAAIAARNLRVPQKGVSQG